MKCPTLKEKEPEFLFLSLSLSPFPHINKREETRISFTSQLFSLFLSLLCIPTIFNELKTPPSDLLSHMRTVMSKSLQESSSKRHFHWTKKVGNEEEEEDHDQIPTLKSISTSKSTQEEKKDHQNVETQEAEPAVVSTSQSVPKRNKLQSVAVSKLRSVLTAFGRNRSSLPNGLGPRVVGTLFGSRRGHVHFAFQRDPNSQPAFLIELATPISGLVREMASGLVRIALECDKEKADQEDSKKTVRLLEEPVWRTYCNGKKCGFATRRECGPKEWKVLKAVEPISMGAGVLPGNEAEAGSDGEVMYMRAKFERIVGSRDSEAFYMMNPDSNGAPELSVYLLRV